MEALLESLPGPHLGAEDADALCIKVWSALNHGGGGRTVISDPQATSTTGRSRAAPLVTSSKLAPRHDRAPSSSSSSSCGSSSSSSNSSSSSSSGPSRQPLKTIPTSLLAQLQNQHSNLQSAQSSRASKWQKPKEPSPERHDMRSVLERRIKSMRQFLEVEPQSGEPENIDGVTDTWCR